MDFHFWHSSVVNFALLSSFCSTHTNQYAYTATYISHLYFLAIFLLESIQTEREQMLRMGHNKNPVSPKVPKANKSSGRIVCLWGRYYLNSFYQVQLVYAHLNQKQENIWINRSKLPPESFIMITRYACRYLISFW